MRVSVSESVLFFMAEANEATGQFDEENNSYTIEDRIKELEKQAENYKDRFNDEIERGFLKRIPKTNSYGEDNGIARNGKILRRRALELYDLYAELDRKSAEAKEHNKVFDPSMIKKKIKQKEIEYKEILDTFKGYLESLESIGLFNDTELAKEINMPSIEMVACLDYFSQYPICLRCIEKNKALVESRQDREGEGKK